jgi:phage recombination protein Bet
LTVNEALVAVAPVVTSDQLELVKRTVASGATDAELKLYLYDCQRQGVHPLDRLLHFTKRGGKYVPVTSIDLMRIRAAETGDYAGSDDAVFHPKPTGVTPETTQPPSAAQVTVWRLVQGTRCSFTATARWSEYYPGDGPVGTMWRKMPHTMLAKCAEALALRKGFPRQLAGLYAREELDQATDRMGANGIDAATGEVLNDTEPTTALPAGYDEWLTDMEAAAETGTALLRQAWKEAKPEHRTAMPTATRDRLRAKAFAADGGIA